MLLSAESHFHCVASGDPRRAAVLFLHGFMGDARDWREITAHLSRHFYCLAMDLPGHGKSIFQTEAEYGISTCAANLMRFLRRLRVETCALAGYSMGGRVALYTALQYPDRVTALVLESASPGLRTAMERAARVEEDARLAAKITGGHFRAFLQEWYRLPLFGALSARPAFDALLRRRLQNDPARLARSLQYMGTGAQPSLWDRLPALETPVLLLTGEGDAKFARLHAEMAALLPNAVHRIIPGAAHSAHFEQPQIFINAVERFLQQQSLFKSSQSMKQSGGKR